MQERRCCCSSSRLLIFKYCLNVPGSSETFTSARWTLLQVCPHVLFEDMFDVLFLQLVKLRHHLESVILDFVRDVYEDAKSCIIKHGCLPRIKDDTRLLVIHDEAQFLGNEFKGSFQSMSSQDNSPRPLLSPILHAFRDIGGHQLTLVTCGTGLSIFIFISLLLHNTMTDNHRNSLCLHVVYPLHKTQQCGISHMSLSCSNLCRLENRPDKRREIPSHLFRPLSCFPLVFLPLQKLVSSTMLLLYFARKNQRCVSRNVQEESRKERSKREQKEIRKNEKRRGDDTLVLCAIKGMSTRMSVRKNISENVSRSSMAHYTFNIVLYLFAGDNSIVAKYEEAVCGRLKTQSDSVVARWIASE